MATRLQKFELLLKSLESMVVEKLTAFEQELLAQLKDHLNWRKAQLSASEGDHLASEGEHMAGAPVHSVHWLM